MTEYITEKFNRKEATGAVLLPKAFDKVWHRGLLINMLNAGFSVGLVKLIRSFLSARRFRVKIDSVYPSYRKMEEQECSKVQYCRHFSLTFMFQIRLELSKPA